MVYGKYIYSIHGVYKPTNITGGAPRCSMPLKCEDWTRVAQSNGKSGVKGMDKQAERQHSKIKSTVQKAQNLVQALKKGTV